MYTNFVVNFCPFYTIYKTKTPILPLKITPPFYKGNKLIRPLIGENNFPHALVVFIFDC